MRLGFIGPADTDAAALEQAAKLLICDLEVDAVIYLGEDDALRDFVAAHESKDSDHTIEQRVADVAATGSADDIEDVLRELRGARYLGKLRVAPPAPRRAMEMLDDRIVLIVRNKSTVGEEDVINSNVVVYGDATELMFKRFGPRCFFSPGPLDVGHVGLLDDRSESGGVVLKAINLSGEVAWSEPIQGRGAKMMVAP
ncbi:MAG: hypothetical protein JRG67_02875 [Deltaproteobacteria bacterium]|nr:hypothetical protein [Deltaproteobacteria bacterium]MBW1873807.1 hypothetical protein [Deltaproteobacteria bacterium]MBW2209978.1 hypothetical protein [Deltaproteobacteria bacterium]MBW2212819.1 hypothetical protein [Deltaproteobacteria bacterium]MBW2379180.1 hypothetical protein [Deltaproteobacteria bacterium]